MVGSTFVAALMKDIYLGAPSHALGSDLTRKPPVQRGRAVVVVWTQSLEVANRVPCLGANGRVHLGAIGTASRLSKHEPSGSLRRLS